MSRAEKAKAIEMPFAVANSCKREEPCVKLEWKYSLESTDPRESEIRAPRQLTIAIKLSCYLFIIAKLFKVKDGCLKFVYIGKNPRYTAFLDSNLHTRLAIVTENELELAFPPRNLPQKIRSDPSTFYLVIVVTNKQTNQRRWFHNPSRKLSRG